MRITKHRVLVMQVKLLFVYLYAHWLHTGLAHSLSASVTKEGLTAGELRCSAELCRVPNIASVSSTW
jgi:hypothetical protein